MMDDPIVLIVVIALSFEMLYALWCANWMRRRYGRRLMHSAVWDRLVEGEMRVVVSCIIILGLVIQGYVVYLLELDQPILPRPIGTVLLSVALGLLLYGPIADKRLMKRLEEVGTDTGEPPSLLDQDV